MTEAHFGNPEKRLKEFFKFHKDTLAIHGGQHPDPSTGALMPPLYLTSTYAQKAPATPWGEFEYSRTHNPTRRMMEDCIALLENANFAMGTSCGMSAIDLVLNLLSTDDHVICVDDVYGGTYRLFTTVMQKQRAINVDFNSFDDLASVEAMITAKTKMIWIESPSNPLLKIVDIKSVAELCKRKNILLVVDNTFASPIFQNPIDLGAHIVVHSLTKYMNGHSDVVAGAVVTDDRKLATELYRLQNSIGQVCGPFDAWLVLRSLKTLAIRMRAHQENALTLAKWLEAHDKVEKVLYPGLESHPQYALAKEQMHGSSGMISFYLKGDLQKTKDFLSKLKVFSLAESLGGVESLIEHPAIMTHASVPKNLRDAAGIGDNFIRISVGLESIEDLKSDFEQAW